MTELHRLTRCVGYRLVVDTVERVVGNESWPSFMLGHNAQGAEPKLLLMHDGRRGKDEPEALLHELNELFAHETSRSGALLVRES